MIPYSYLPDLNAILNSASAVLLVAGFMRIRRGDRAGHRRFMISALVTSSLFLISYLIYHAHAGTVRFRGEGTVRTVYMAVLISHTLLAAAVMPMVLITVWFASSEKFGQHRRIARLTFPVWLYVSITGVAVYLMLYRMHF